MERREFLTRTLAAAGMGAVARMGPMTRARADAGADGRLARRPYGKTGEALSIIGFGGIVVSQVEQSLANDAVARAVDRGVNYFDVAPTYGDAEDRLGPALEPYRDGAFLACKTAVRDAEGAQRELETSLVKLRTDHFDLYQIHGLSSVAEAEQVLAPGGALETLVQARERGDVHYLGFSAHSEEAALMMMNAFDFDSLLFPFNCVCMMNGNFGHRALAKAQEKGIACLALKALAHRPWPEGAERVYAKCWYEPIDDEDLARLALRYTLSLGEGDEPAVTAAVPPGDERLFELALSAALAFEPLSEDELASLKQAVEGSQPIFAA